MCYAGSMGIFREKHYVFAGSYGYVCSGTVGIETDIVLLAVFPGRDTQGGTAFPPYGLFGFQRYLDVDILAVRFKEGFIRLFAVKFGNGDIKVFSVYFNHPRRK